jgi:hypothetical protein
VALLNFSANKTTREARLGVANGLAAYFVPVFAVSFRNSFINIRDSFDGTSLP